MANILTEAEAAAVLRTTEDDELMLDILPQVDAYIAMATGRDWSADSPVRPEAKAAARMLLVKWHEDPGAMGVAFGGALGFGLNAALIQLEALALELESALVPQEALAIRSSVPVDGAREFSPQANLVVLFNHAMADSALGAVSLVDELGNLVPTSVKLDVTRKILTLSATGGLAAASGYTLRLQAAADVYGMTLTRSISFRTV